MCLLTDRIVDNWNVLPDSCIECTTLNAFKTKIKLQLEPETHIECNVWYVSDNRLYMAICVCLCLSRCYLMFLVR